jgi:hypothetical protein
LILFLNSPTGCAAAAIFFFPRPLSASYKPGDRSGGPLEVQLRAKRG